MLVLPCPTASSDPGVLKTRMTDESPANQPTPPVTSDHTPSASTVYATSASVLPTRGSGVGNGYCTSRRTIAGVDVAPVGYEALHETPNHKVRTRRIRGRNRRTG